MFFHKDILLTILSETLVWRHKEWQSNQHVEPNAGMQVLTKCVLFTACKP